MANMIKFYRGLVETLPVTGENGALYITTDEGAIYLGTGEGMKRLGDFIQVPSVSNLPTAGANVSALYYCVTENILAKWNGSDWTQINKQPTADELKNLLSLGDLAYLSEVAKTNLASALVTEIEGKVASVSVGDNSVTIGGTDTAPTVAVKISADTGNALTLASDGLKVSIPAAAEYSIVKAANSGDYAAVYNLTKDGTIVGASINIPKDLVVKSGEVINNEIVLVLNDEASTEIKIPASALIEYVTSGSATDDMVVVSVDSTTHKVTATLTDGKVTLSKLDSETQEKIRKAHNHENNTVLDGITSDKVEAWDNAEKNAKDYADGLIDELVAEDITDFATEVAKVKVAEATKATQDGSGRNIVNTYYTKTEVEALLTWGTF